MNGLFQFPKIVPQKKRKDWDKRILYPTIIITILYILLYLSFIHSPSPENVLWSSENGGGFFR